MSKLKIDDLARIREAAKRQTTLRQGAGRAKITVHMGTCGIAAGARDIMAAVIDEVDRRQLHDVIVTNSGCAGLCSKEPMLTVELADETAPVKYILVTPEKVRKIIEGHVIGGKVVADYALALGSEKTR